LVINPALGVAQPRLPLQEMRFLDATDLEHLADEMPTERDRVLTMLSAGRDPAPGKPSPSVAGTSTHSDAE
jgi:hypothetical protein